MKIAVLKSQNAELRNQFDGELYAISCHFIVTLFIAFFKSSILDLT